MISLALFFALLTPSPSSAQEIRVGHGSSIDAIFLEVQKEMAAKKNKVSTKPIHAGGLTGDSILAELDREKIDLGISGNSWSSLMKVVEQKKLDFKNLSKMKSTVIGNDRIVVIVSEGLPTTLTEEQVKKLFTGKVENWKDLGGPDLPVKYFITANTRATQTAISTAWLGGEAFRTRTPVEVRSMADAVNMVKTTKGAVSFVSTFVDAAGVSVLAKPVLDREITAIHMGDAKPEFKEVFQGFSSVLNRKTK